MTRKEKPKDYFSTAYFNYLVDISAYRANNQMNMIEYDLNKDLYKKVTKEMKKNPNLLEELNYDNPPIEMGNIYIIKLKTFHGMSLSYADGMEWSDYWEDDVTRYRDISDFGYNQYLAVIKLPSPIQIKKIKNKDTPYQRDVGWPLWCNPNTWTRFKDFPENYYFSIMLPQEMPSNVYSRANSLAKQYPIYFAKGERQSPIDDEEGKWSWTTWSKRLSINEYSFPAGSTWALLKTWPNFLNWGNTYPFEVK